MFAAAGPWLRVAAIVRPHGIRGEVVAEVLTDFPSRFAPGSTLHLRSAGAEAIQCSVEVERSRMHEGRVLLKLIGINSRNDAETLRGCDLVIPASLQAEADADSIHMTVLLGARLLDRANGEVVGEIIDVDRGSTQFDLLVVQRAAGPEVLVPFAKAYAPEWNEAARALTMTLPDGLLALNETFP